MLALNEILQERYRIIRQLGHGGMGAVYEARDERLGSSVALKEIIIEMDKIPTEVQRELFRRAFEREAKLLANLHHEVFPRVMDYFSEQSRQFLIMELVYGDDLSELLKKNKKPFTFDKVARWVDDLLDALDYLHTQKPPTFHRDIKPQNLKLTSRGKIKLLDFGIAKSVDQTGSTITNQTFIGATLDYAPIEQVLPATPTAFREFIVLKHQDKATAILEQSTDARCDLYAVGATFYHLLTNRVPIDSAQRSLQIWEGNQDPLPNPSELNPDISPTISAWLLKALEVDRENRFSSAIEMQKALQTAIREAKKETAQETLILPAQILTENQKEQAETEILIKTEPLPNETNSQVNSETQPSPTHYSDTQWPLIQGAVTEPLPFESDTSGNISPDEQTETPYFDLKLIDGNKTSPEIKPVVNKPFKEQKPPKKTALLWAVPTVLIGVLAVAGAGGLVWLGIFSSNQSVSNKSVSNVVVSTPTPTPVSTNASISTTPIPTASPITTPSVSTTDESKPSPTQTKVETPRPTVTTTPNRTPTPVIKKKTPKPVKIPDRSDDCIYNKKCRN